jgi:transcriptional antiterminator NusG
MRVADWYIIHASAGSENRVATELRAQFDRAGLGHQLSEVLVPKKSVPAIRRGVKIQVDERILPGYVLVHMECTPETLHVIRRVPRVVGMLGADSHGIPRPLSQGEVSQFLAQLETIHQSTTAKVVFEPGELVRVSEGLFSSMEGVVEEIDMQRFRLKVSISILGRPTPIDLEFSQVEKLS